MSEDESCKYCLESDRPLYHPCHCTNGVCKQCLHRWVDTARETNVRKKPECPECKYRYRIKNKQLRWVRIMTTQFVPELVSILILFIILFLTGFIVQMNSYHTVLNYTKTDWYNHFYYATILVGIISFIGFIIYSLIYNWDGSDFGSDESESSHSQSFNDSDSDSNELYSWIIGIIFCIIVVCGLIVITTCIYVVITRYISKKMNNSVIEILNKSDIE